MGGGNSYRVNGYADIKNNILIARVSTVSIRNRYFIDNVQMARVPAPPIISYAQKMKEKLIQELFWRR